MLSFFKKKAAKSEEAANGKTMKAYLTGKVIPIEEVNDGVFSAKIMGDGIAIIPENEVLDNALHFLGKVFEATLFSLNLSIQAYADEG